MEYVQKKAGGLTEYFNWVREIVAWRYYQDSKDSFDNIINQIPQPEHNPDSLFFNIQKEFDLSTAELFVLLLSLSSYYIPDFF